MKSRNAFKFLLVIGLGFFSPFMLLSQKVSNFFGDGTNFMFKTNCKIDLGSEAKTYSHSSGYEIELQPGQTLNLYVRNDPTIGYNGELKVYDNSYSSSDGALLYYYYAEKNSGTKWDTFCVNATSKPIKLRIKANAEMEGQPLQEIMVCPCSESQYVAGVQLPRNKPGRDDSFNDIQMIFFISNQQN